jgi:hypothetical protein
MYKTPWRLNKVTARWYVRRDCYCGRGEGVYFRRPIVRKKQIVSRRGDWTTEIKRKRTFQSKRICDVDGAFRRARSYFLYFSFTKSSRRHVGLKIALRSTRTTGVINNHISQPFGPQLTVGVSPPKNESDDRNGMVLCYDRLSFWSF